MELIIVTLLAIGFFSTIAFVIGRISGEKKAFLDSMKARQEEQQQRAWQSFMEGFKNGKG